MTNREQCWDCGAYDDHGAVLAARDARIERLRAVVATVAREQWILDTSDDFRAALAALQPGDMNDA